MSVSKPVLNKCIDISLTRPKEFQETQPPDPTGLANTQASMLADMVIKKA